MRRKSEKMLIDTKWIKYIVLWKEWLKMPAEFWVYVLPIHLFHCDTLSPLCLPTPHHSAVDV